MIAVVDYGLGNLASVQNAFHRVEAPVAVTSRAEVIARADGIVLPGVGAASAGMKRMRERGLDGVVRQVALSGRPVLGLCLGMQLLFDRSEEGDATCLGLLPGVVRRLQGEVKVPHIGWNDVYTRGEPSMFRDLPAHSYFYFVHSYICVPDDEGPVAGVTHHGEQFCSAVAQGAIWGTQFHPERSGRAGLQLLANFAEVCRAPLIGYTDDELPSSKTSR